MRKITNSTQDVVNLVLGSVVKTINPNSYVYITGRQYADYLSDINALVSESCISVGSWEYDSEDFNSAEDSFPHGVTGLRPSSPPTGYVFFDETFGKNIVYTGTVWANVDGTAL